MGKRNGKRTSWLSGFFHTTFEHLAAILSVFAVVLCHVVIPLHVLAVSAKHCNILVYHLSNTVPYLFPAVQIHSKRSCFRFMDVASTWLANKLTVGSLSHWIWSTLQWFYTKKTLPELQRQDVLRAQRWGSGGAPEKQKTSWHEMVV